MNIGTDGIGGINKPSKNEIYVDQVMSNRELNDYEKIEAVKRKAN